MAIRLFAFAAAAVLACSATPRESRLVAALDMCPCAADAGPDGPVLDAAPDAAVDAQLELDAALDAPVDAAPPPDAPPPGPLSISLTAAWTRQTITAGAFSGTYRGADGVTLGPDACIYTPWEEGGSITRACGPLTELVATSLPGVEEAVAADMDADGIVDVASCSDSGARCYVTFRGGVNVSTTLTASMGHGRVVAMAIADVDGDGDLDIIYGTRAAAPAVFAWLANPGATARTGSAWTYHLIGTAGWAMTIIPRDVDHDGDVDVVVSDRSYYLAANGTRLWDLNGVRWLEQTSSGWINHPISPPSGSCPVGQPMCTTRTPGDVMFASIDGDDVWSCQSSDGAAYSRIARYRTTDWVTWTTTVLPAVPDVGHCQGVYPADVDRDGTADLVVSSWKGNALPLSPTSASQSGVYWLRYTGTVYVRGEISGTAGAKFDDVLVLDWDGDGRLDVITSEQLEQLGVVAYLNPGVP